MAWIIDYAKEYYIAVIIQIINIPIYAIVFWSKRKDKFLLLSMVCCVLFALGYAFLDAWAGTIVAIFTLLIVAISYYYEKNKINNRVKIITWIISSLMIVALNLIFDNSLFSFLAISAGLINNFNYIVLKKNGFIMKSFFLISHLMLIAYETIYALPIFALLDLIAFLSIFFSIINLYSKEKKQI